MGRRLTTAALAAAAVALVFVPAAAAPAKPRPLVWVQAGHEGPRRARLPRADRRSRRGAVHDPGRGSRRAAPARGGDRRAPHPVAGHPTGAAGAVFVSIHHDTPQGHAAIGHAIAGVGENWYHGEGTGTRDPPPIRIAHRTAPPPPSRLRSRRVRGGSPSSSRAATGRCSRGENGARSGSGAPRAALRQPADDAVLRLLPFPRRRTGAGRGWCRRDRRRDPAQHRARPPAPSRAPSWRTCGLRVNSPRGRRAPLNQVLGWWGGRRGRPTMAHGGVVRLVPVSEPRRTSH